MLQGEAMGVQHLTFDLELGSPRRCAAILPIADDGVPDKGHVNPDLMCASRFYVNPYLSQVFQLMQHFIMGDGGASPGGACAHFFPVMRAAPDQRFDGSLAFF